MPAVTPGRPDIRFDTLPAFNGLFQDVAVLPIHGIIDEVSETATPHLAGRIPEGGFQRSHGLPGTPMNTEGSTGMKETTLEAQSLS